MRAVVKRYAQEVYLSDSYEVVLLCACKYVFALKTDV